MNNNKDNIGDYIFIFIVGITICVLLSAMFS